MKQKIILILLSTILSSGCFDAKEKKDLSPAQKPNVTGEWHLCKKITSSSTKSYNVCPILTFDEAGKGTLKNPMSTSEFLWSIKGDSIYFSFAKEEDEELFLSKEHVFKLNSYEDTDFEYLEVINEKPYYKFILSRVNTEKK